MSESLKDLSDLATPGEWLQRDMPNEGNSPSDKFTSYGIEANGKTLVDGLNSSLICLEEDHDGQGWATVWDEQGRRDTAFVVALVNAYRAGELVPSTAKAQGRAEGIREAAEIADEMARRCDSAGHDMLRETSAFEAQPEASRADFAQGHLCRDLSNLIRARLTAGGSTDAG